MLPEARKSDQGRQVGRLPVTLPIRRSYCSSQYFFRRWLLHLFWLRRARLALSCRRSRVNTSRLVIRIYITYYICCHLSKFLAKGRRYSGQAIYQQHNHNDEKNHPFHPALELALEAVHRWRADGWLELDRWRGVINISLRPQVRHSTICSDGAQTESHGIIVGSTGAVSHVL